MGVSEPRVRRRGFFLHSNTGEAETGELENPEGFVVRVRLTNAAASRHLAVTRAVPGTRFSGGRSRTSSGTVDDAQPGIRSGSVTGSRQRAHLPR